MKILKLSAICIVLTLSIIGTSYDTFAATDLYSGTKNGEVHSVSINGSTGTSALLNNWDECCILSYSWLGSTLYATAHSDSNEMFMSVNTNDHSYNYIGDTPFVTFSMAYDGNALYASGYDTSNRTNVFYSIDPNTGSTTEIARTVYRAEGMEYYNGLLYAGNRNGALFTIDPLTGDGTILGHTDQAVAALTIVDGEAYGGNENGIYSIDWNTGASTMISGSPTSVQALAPVAVAPEPVSSTLFILGAATLGFRRFRK